MQDSIFPPFDSGSFSPDDLNLMQRVFDAVCAGVRVAADAAERRATIASDIMALYSGGARCETALLTAMMARAA